MTFSPNVRIFDGKMLTSVVSRFVKSGQVPVRRLREEYVDPGNSGHVHNNDNNQNRNQEDDDDDVHFTRIPSNRPISNDGPFHNVGSIGADFEMTAASVLSGVPDETYTLDEAVNSFGFGRFQIKLSLLTGLCWMADSMEMMILSILSPALRCHWGLSDVQVASITTIVFTGMMISSPFWGKFSDKFGRKTTLMIGGVLLAYYGLLSAFAATYVWMLILRGMVGFGMGCVPQGVTLYAEFLPTNQRGKCVILMDSFWALGACMEVLLALFVMPSLGWQWLLGLSAVPLVLFLTISTWLPESARFHAVNGQYEKAIAVVQKIAKDNGKVMPAGRLTFDDTQDLQRGRIRDLFIPDLKKTTLLLWYMWFSCAFAYYGIVLVTTELFQVDDQCHGGKQGTNEPGCSATCKPLTTGDYTNLLWTTLAEFPGMLITTLVIDRFGRRKTMAVESLLYSCLVLLLLICGFSKSLLTVLLFVARGSISGVFNAIYVYTPEVYPTTLRAVGVGMCSGIARIGAMSTPFVAQVLLKYSVGSALAVYAVVGLTACVIALMLPIETTNRNLKVVTLLLLFYPKHKNSLPFTYNFMTKILSRFQDSHRKHEVR